MVHKFYAKKNTNSTSFKSEVFQRTNLPIAHSKTESEITALSIKIQVKNLKPGLN
jgi:hypothetical protein